MGIMDKLKDTMNEAIERGKQISYPSTNNANEKGTQDSSNSSISSQSNSSNARYKTVYVEAGSGVFKNSYEKLAPKIDEACNNLARDGYRVFSIIAPGFGGAGQSQVFVTGVKNLD